MRARRDVQGLGGPTSVPSTPPQALSIPVAHVPEKVTEQLFSTCVSRPTLLTPGYLRYSLRGLQPRAVATLPPELARGVLEYCLSDVTVMSADTVRDLCDL